MNIFNSLNRFLSFAGNKYYGAMVFWKITRQFTVLNNLLRVQ
jgi:hypothetical protein